MTRLDGQFDGEAVYREFPFLLLIAVVPLFAVTPIFVRELELECELVLFMLGGEMLVTFAGIAGTAFVCELVT